MIKALMNNHFWEKNFLVIRRGLVILITLMAGIFFLTFFHQPQKKKFDCDKILFFFTKIETKNFEFLSTLQAQKMRV